MTDALKTAVREAWDEIYGNLPVESAADKFTTALTRCGVVVLERCGGHCASPLCGVSCLSRLASSPLLIPPTPPRSDVEAVAPVRRVVQYIPSPVWWSFVLCDDGALLYQEVEGSPWKERAFNPPVPQPGAEP